MKDSERIELRKKVLETLDISDITKLYYLKYKKDNEIRFHSVMFTDKKLATILCENINKTDNATQTLYETYTLNGISLNLKNKRAYKSDLGVFKVCYVAADEYERLKELNKLKTEQIDVLGLRDEYIRLHILYNV